MCHIISNLKWKVFIVYTEINILLSVKLHYEYTSMALFSPVKCTLNIIIIHDKHCTVCDIVCVHNVSFVVACTRNGIQYQVNEEILTDCNNRCTCQANGTFTCVPQLCPPIDGSVCFAVGDPHYRTFDGRSFVFHGTCEYVMTQFCGNDDFTISVNNDLCIPTSTVACATGVRIIVKNGDPSDIFINSQFQLYFNGVLQQQNFFS